jgi:hypothetical protein
VLSRVPKDVVARRADWSSIALSRLPLAARRQSITFNFDVARTMPLRRMRHSAIGDCALGRRRQLASLEDELCPDRADLPALARA